MIRILINVDKVVGYSDEKKHVQNFIKSYNLTDYRIEKIKKIPREIEFDFQNKEIYFDAHYDTYVTEELLEKVSIVCQEICGMYIGVRDMLDDALTYIKFTSSEEDDVINFKERINEMVNDLIGADEMSGPNAFYSDYFDVRELIREFLHKNIVIYGGD